MTFVNGIKVSVAAVICLGLLTACTKATENEPANGNLQQVADENNDRSPNTDSPGRRDQLSAPHESEHRELRNKIMQAATQRQADDIQQCQLIPFGHRPCGGAESYLLYSRQNMTDDELAELQTDINRFNELDRIIKSARQIVGTCQVIPEPTIQLVNNRCVAQPGSAHVPY
ncbi:hypothetical protein CWE09_05900 [Aliidiomarina minuta]|uniref:Secreted protein n=1 Tax=Aliidiomarina minuta TaxID=880057 RepID=A0A432W811_9GAMM|nr:hypothetical protein [Aliidiomarina minuta]RUO26247.1 hypothetical protein CWE09_05900 [Aliidiomarina minuta]